MHAKTLRLVDPYLHLWTAFSTWLYGVCAERLLFVADFVFRPLNSLSVRCEENFFGVLPAEFYLLRNCNPLRGRGMVWLSSGRALGLSDCVP